MAVLHVRQGITYRAVFAWTDPTNAGAPIPLTGFTARFRAMRRAGGDPLVDISSVHDPTALQVEPGGAVGEVHLRLGANVTELLHHDGTYQVDVTAVDDPTETAFMSSGTIDLQRVGA